MAERFEVTVNETLHTIEVEPDTPLLYVLINDLRLKGPRFGCGLAQCGSCSVLLDGAELRACVTPISAVGRRAITTLEGLPQWYAQRHGLEDAPELHPVQQAMIDEQAIQCGYCFNGMIIKASELLEGNTRPSMQEIKAAMNGHLCRCGMYPRIVKAVQAAAAKMLGEPA
jgi:aerobic-type carbon monoxide dehydrogenase small subunit (CoxS/CutS family)